MLRQWQSCGVHTTLGEMTAQCPPYSALRSLTLVHLPLSLSSQHRDHNWPLRSQPTYIQCLVLSAEMYSEMERVLLPQQAMCCWATHDDEKCSPLRVLYHPVCVCARMCVRAHTYVCAPAYVCLRPENSLGCSFEIGSPTDEVVEK